MCGLHIFSKECPKQELIDIREAFILWDILASKYFMMEQLQIWENIVQDASVKRLVLKSKIDISDNIDILEKQLEKFVIPPPDKSRAFAIERSQGKSEMVTEKNIVMNIFLYQQEHIENMLTGIHRSHTNDELRNLFAKILRKTLNLLDEVILQINKKGWHSVPPPYQPLPPNSSESMGCAEAANLWDHLAIRYDNLHVTEIMSNLAHDKDFKIVLDMGINLLTDQINLLEKELKRYGIPVPERPNDVALPKDLKLSFSDKHFYRDLLAGMHSASLIHAKSFKQCTTNQRVRKLFKNLLLVEVDKFDNFLKFGKMKKWLHTVPLYKP